jgi:hypothetical protein
MVVQCDPVDIDPGAPDDDRQKHAFARQCMQLLECRPAERANVELIVGIGEREHPISELIPRAVGGAHHVALGRERRERAVHHVLVHAEPVRELGHAEIAIGPAERGEHCEHPLRRLVAIARLGPGGILCAAHRLR